VIRSICGPIPKEAADAILALANGADRHAALDVPGMRVRRESDVLSFGATALPDLAGRELPLGETPLPEIGMRAVRRPLAPGEEIHNSFNTFFFQYGLIRGMIFVASRQQGDSIRLLGRGCTKTLKKLFSEAEIPIADRSMIPVLSDSDGVIAVAGFGVSERCAAKNAENAMCIEIKTLEA
jgi:tRNA(Ile)-lysidine synthase